MDKRKVKLTDVIEMADKFCNIPAGVVKERMRYMKQLGDQVEKSYNTLKQQGRIK